MAKARSPQYPAIGLKEAVDKIAAVYTNDYQNKTTREVIAKHMGYDSLHGKALGVLSALGKYGLLEGRADENRVSDLAVTIIAHPPGSPERAAALREAAGKPELFAEIDSRFNGGKGSDTAIRSYLLTQKFIPGAADLAIRSYRETKQLVEAESEGYNGLEEPQPEPIVTPQTQTLPKGAAPLPPSSPVRVVMNGNRLDIQASVDLEGLKKLQAMLAKYESILEMATEIPPMANMEKDERGVWKPKGQ